MSLLRANQVAERLNISYGAVLQLIHAQELPTVQLPGRRSHRIDESDVQAFIERLKSGTVPGTEDEAKPTQTAPNKESRERSRKKKNGGNESWMQRYTKK